MKKGKMILPENKRANILTTVKLTAQEDETLRKLAIELEEFYVSRTIRRLIKEAGAKYLKTKAG